MSLLMARSCWTEQAVACLLKARPIAFGLEWVFPSKEIEMFGGGFDLLHTMPGWHSVLRVLTR